MCDEQVPCLRLPPSQRIQSGALLLRRQGRRQGVGPVDVVQILRRGQPQPQKVQLLEHSNLPPYIKSFPYSAS